MEATLKLETRDGAGKGVARKLRRAGRVPGIVYGGNQDPILVSMDHNTAVLVFQGISTDNTILDLDIEGVGHAQALARDIQVHPHRTEVVHVDFVRVQKGVLLEVQIPVHLEGTPEGVRTEGGVLEHVVHEISVRCIPSNIPASLDVDVTHLGIGDIIRAGEIALPEGVELLLDEARTICHVSAPRVVESEGDEDGEEPEGDAAVAEPES